MNLDVAIFEQINNLAGQCAFLDAVGVFFASYLQYILAAFALIIFRKKIRVLFEIFTAVALARLGVVELIHLFWSRSRPFVENNVNLLIGHEKTGSFPSGHATLFFALSTVIYLHNKKAGIIFFIASLFISLARIFAGVHWPTDILGGAVLGAICGWLVVKFFKRF